jgi:type IV pilus assembly protein PilB
MRLPGSLGEGRLGETSRHSPVVEDYGLPSILLAGLKISAEVLAALPRSFVLEHNVMPFAQAQGRLRVAISDPLALDIIDGLHYVAGRPVQVELASSADIRAAIAFYYSAAPDLRANHRALGLSVEPGAQLIPAVAEISDASPQEAPIIRLVHDIIAEAIRRRASDIHLEPLASRLRVRYRIDGVMQEVAAPPKQFELALLSRVKIMANLSIAEKRLPQDGRLRFVAAGRSLDLRVSSLPTAHGESMVLRVLDPASLPLGLPELGFEPDDERAFAQLLQSPDGIVLVTGPTGSGKTTSLYAALHHLNQSDRKIITVEDPVEYQLSGVNQVPVNPDIGMTFAAALRALLRQAPNIVMVGEIRDRETAEIALNAALTGHLVFSTLHTNDAPSAVTRLLDIGVKPFLIAAALRAVLGQRLVRRICRNCRRAYTPSPREIYALELTPPQVAAAEFACGAGCATCGGTGYYGRLGIFELCQVDDNLRELIYAKAPAIRLREQARRAGLRSLREDGVRKVLAGLTTIEEILATT